mgnify:CR=1 FL=1
MFDTKKGHFSVQLIDPVCGLLQVGDRYQISRDV